MKQFAGYVASLVELVERSSDGRRLMKQDVIAPILDGQPSRELRRLVSIEKQRKDGVFFTGSRMAENITSCLKGQLSSMSVVTDPTCGAGDLLLACAKHLPRKDGLIETLGGWGDILRGSDIHADLIRLSRLRLVLQALQLGVKQRRISGANVESLFPRLRVQDGLNAIDDLRESTHIVTNPPFAMVQAPDACRWATGSVNAAAVFLDTFTGYAQPDTRILAILPDVLRSGSRYAKWRNVIDSRLSDITINLVGRFSIHADVDVFVMKGTRKGHNSTALSSANRINQGSEHKGHIVGDRFAVHVGPLVPFRHKKKGGSFPFLATANCPAWETVREIQDHRRFSGTVFRPPFVVVRRTSRPDDRNRAVGSIVVGKTEVAVENHLLVLIPHSGKLSDCSQLLQVLRRPKTSNWLNQRIRCRHLTVSALRSVPWISEKP